MYRCSWKVRDHPLDIDKAVPQMAFILHELTHRGQHWSGGDVLRLTYRGAALVRGWSLMCDVVVVGRCVITHWT